MAAAAMRDEIAKGWRKEVSRHVSSVYQSIRVFIVFINGSIVATAPLQVVRRASRTYHKAAIDIIALALQSKYIATTNKSLFVLVDTFVSLSGIRDSAFSHNTNVFH